MTSLKKKTLQLQLTLPLPSSKLKSNCSKCRLNWMYGQTFPEQNTNLEESWMVSPQNRFIFHRPRSTFPSSEEPLGHHIKLLDIHFSIAIIQGAIISNHQSVVSIQDSYLTFERPRSTFPSSEELQGIISNFPISSSVVSRSSSSGLAVSKALSYLHH